MVAMVHAGGSKSSKNGKGGGRWSGGGRLKDSYDSWSSPDWWGQDDHDDNWGGQDRDDIWWGSGKGGHDDKWWGWYCTLANPVQEQYDLIIKTWKIAYLPTNANAAAIKTYEEVTTSHANMMMNKFMKIVEDYEGGGKTTPRDGSLFIMCAPTSNPDNIYCFLLQTLTRMQSKPWARLKAKLTQVVSSSPLMIKKTQFVP